MLQQVRKIKPTRRSVSGVYMFRNDSRVFYESTLERDFIVRQEFFRNVLDVIPQPVEIEWVDRNGRKQKYTPDFMVYYRLGTRHWEDYPKPMLVEVKPEKEWRNHWREWMPKWKAAWRYAKEIGAIFHIYDESRIRDVVFENIMFLKRYKQMQFAIEDSQWILESVNEMGCAPFHYILSRHFNGIYRAQGIAHIWHLLAARAIDCDISRPLNNFTELWVANHE